MKRIPPSEKMRQELEALLKGENTGYRNGYDPFHIKTAEGKFCVYKPQVRDTERPFCSKLAAFFRNNSQVLEKLVIETNLVERSLAGAQKDKNNFLFLTEKSALKLVFSVLIRAAKRWRKVSFTKIELNCLDRLKEELGTMEGFQNKQDKQELKGVC